MPSLVPVDFDPFASQPGQPAGGPTLEPVNYDPFNGSAPAPAEPAKAEDISWGDVPLTAASNVLPSAARFGSDLLHAVIHPIDTVTNLGRVGLGAAEKLIPGEQGHEQYANAVGQFFADRYGGVDNLKHTMATDPVGFLADVSTVLTGGSMAAARAPGMAGRVAEVAGKVANAVDPVAGAVNATKTAGRTVGNVASSIAGVTTGAGTLPFKEAVRAGFEGGEAAKTFRENMRGDVPMTDVIDDAKRGLAAIKTDREAAYNAGMTGVRADDAVLSFGNIDKAMAAVRKVGEFQGKKSGLIVSLEPSAKNTMREIDDVLTTWRDLPAEDFHTASGFDALKQRLGDIVDSTAPGTRAQKVATQAYNIVKNQIVAQAPEYAKTMKSYAEASDLIRNIEKTLSIKPTATVDTQLRKLQSVMRDGVNTNYGQRTTLVKMLQDAGAENILRKLAGQALKDLAPRGVARWVATGVRDLPALGLIALNPQLWPVAIGTLLSNSPRAMGELAYYMGRVPGAVSRAPVVKEAVNAASKVPAKVPLRAAYELRGGDRETARP